MTYLIYVKGIGETLLKKEETWELPHCLPPSTLKLAWRESLDLGQLSAGNNP